MSKPKPIEYILDGWLIEYVKNPYDIGTTIPEFVHYKATIKWGPINTIFTNNKVVSEKEWFKTFEEAEEWIKKEIKDE